MQDIIKQLILFFEIDWGNVLDYFLSLFFTTILTYFIIIVIRFVLHQFFKKTNFLDEKIEATIESVVKNTSNYIVFIVIIIAAIKPFIGNLRELIVAGGIIAAVIGFGAQKLINDLLSGIFMIFEKTIQKGDFVNINGEPEGGTIEEIGFRAIKIRLLNGKLVTIPNGEIRRMVNGSVEMRRIFESIIVSFHENPEKVTELLQEICDELNERHKGYLKRDKYTGEYVEPYRVYGLHSLDTSPYGLKFSITATVNDHDYTVAAQETKLLVAKRLYEDHILMPSRQIFLQNDGNHDFMH
ncbi:mechanosensitive ion channel family protein [Caldibacillus lycopersici]|uniref:Mechanosensitive ion channel family protein n=1 Tax=Perspicuibacillus lycopersici TaxID=1325689 RepID=A0AAE3IZ13_9BACI|nr:mechanosensitive ion channel family protein [Perspicuibacillus lycopersici]MCU9614670.1 mechanosensitive ion channel family protein [Perspicuibacillus lycopersici]